MMVADFDFALPEELIAQAPPPVRGDSRMLVLDRTHGGLTDDTFPHLAHYLRAGDLLVLNDSRVMPSRLYATRVRDAATQPKSPDPSGSVEVLLTKQAGPETWTALVRPGRKVQVGTRLHFADLAGVPVLAAEVVMAGEFGERTLRFDPVEDFHVALERIGHMPLPPYIHRGDDAGDRSRYQTVYAQEPGSVAAPTAGLHFTPAVLAELAAKGVQVEFITLHVGLGTFQPVREDRLEDIRLHSERYTIPARTAAAVNAARREGRRILAAGTTTTRTLEHCALLGPELQPHSGETSIFLQPGHVFQLVSGLLTNFHLPRSTLLMLVSAFAGREAVLAAYAHVVAERYRFFSYGDCMLLL